MVRTRPRQTEREFLEAHEWLKPLRIAFGDVFLYSHDGSSRYVITDVGKGKTFGAIIINGNGVDEWIMTSSGTSEREDIEKIIGHWDLERLKRAVLNGWGNRQPGPIEFLQAVEKNSLQKSRVLSP